MATNDPKDKGVYNNWRPASEMRPLLEDRMRGALAGQDDVRHPLPDGAAGQRRWRRGPPASSSPTPAPSCCT